MTDKLVKNLVHIDVFSIFMGPPLGNRGHYSILDAASLFHDLLEVEVAAVGGLVLFIDSRECLLERILRRRVEHLRLDRRVVVRPVARGWKTGARVGRAARGHATRGLAVGCERAPRPLSTAPPAAATARKARDEAAPRGRRSVRGCRHNAGRAVHRCRVLLAPPPLRLRVAMRTHQATKMSLLAVAPDFVLISTSRTE